MFVFYYLILPLRLDFFSCLSNKNAFIMVYFLFCRFIRFGGDLGRNQKRSRKLEEKRCWNRKLMN